MLISSFNPWDKPFSCNCNLQPVRSVVIGRILNRPVNPVVKNSEIWVSWVLFYVQSMWMQNEVLIYRRDSIHTYNVSNICLGQKVSFKLVFKTFNEHIRVEYAINSVAGESPPLALAQWRYLELIKNIPIKKNYLKNENKLKHFLIS